MKKILRKVILPVMLLAMTFILAGCDMNIHYTVDSNSNVTARAEETFSLEEVLSLLAATEENEGAAAQYLALLDSEEFVKEMDESFAETEGYAGKTIGDDGRTYYTIVALEGEEVDASLSPEYTITSSEFVYSPLVIDSKDIQTLEAFEELGLTEEYLMEFAECVKYTISVTMPSEIVLTNGVLSKDKKTATFDIDNYTETSYFAYTAESYSKIALDGTFGGKYTRSKELTVICSEKLKSITVNGVDQTDETIKVKKDGNYEIKVATDKTEKIFNVIKDTKAPKVSGVKNNKIYDKSVKIKFSDKASGIKSATLNGVEITNKTKVKKNGSYTLVVIDNAGNIKTVNFTVNK